MKLTVFGTRLLNSKQPLRYDDFTLHRYDETRWQFSFDLPRPSVAVALHEGTSVEAARLFKLLLITRRLT